VLNDDGTVETNYDEVIESFDDMGLKEDLLRGIYSYGFEARRARTKHWRTLFSVGLATRQASGWLWHGPRTDLLSAVCPNAHPRRSRRPSSSVQSSR
jgi:hypothetical protein